MKEGKSSIHITISDVKAKNLPKIDLFNKGDPYIFFHWPKVQEFRTPTLSKETNCDWVDWSHSFHFLIPKCKNKSAELNFLKTEQFILEVFSKSNNNNNRKDHLFGFVSIHLFHLFSGPQYHVLSLFNERGMIFGATVEFNIKIEYQREVIINLTDIFYRPPSSSLPPSSYFFTAKISSLPSDSFVIIIYYHYLLLLLIISYYHNWEDNNKKGDKRESSGICYKNGRPHWNSLSPIHYFADIQTLYAEEIEIEVYSIREKELKREGGGRIQLNRYNTVNDQEKLYFFIPILPQPLPSPSFPFLHLHSSPPSSSSSPSLSLGSLKHRSSSSSSSSSQPLVEDEEKKEKGEMGGFISYDHLPLPAQMLHGYHADGIIFESLPILSNLPFPSDFTFSKKGAESQSLILPYLNPFLSPSDNNNNNDNINDDDDDDDNDGGEYSNLLPISSSSNDNDNINNDNQGLIVREEGEGGGGRAEEEFQSFLQYILSSFHSQSQQIPQPLFGTSLFSRLSLFLSLLSSSSSPSSSNSPSSPSPSEGRIFKRKIDKRGGIEQLMEIIINTMGLLSHPSLHSPSAPSLSLNGERKELFPPSFIRLLDDHFIHFVICLYHLLFDNYWRQEKFRKNGGFSLLSQFLFFIFYAPHDNPLNHPYFLFPLFTHLFLIFSSRDSDMQKELNESGNEFMSKLLSIFLDMENILSLSFPPLSSPLLPPIPLHLHSSIPHLITQQLISNLNSLSLSPSSSSDNIIIPPYHGDNNDNNHNDDVNNVNSYNNNVNNDDVNNKEGREEKEKERKKKEREMGYKNIFLLVNSLSYRCNYPSEKINKNEEKIEEIVFTAIPKMIEILYDPSDDLRRESSLFLQQISFHNFPLQQFIFDKLFEQGEGMNEEVKGMNEEVIDLINAIVDQQEGYYKEVKEERQYQAVDSIDFFDLISPPPSSSNLNAKLLLINKDQCKVILDYYYSHLSSPSIRQSINRWLRLFIQPYHLSLSNLTFILSSFSLSRALIEISSSSSQSSSPLSSSHSSSLSLNKQQQRIMRGEIKLFQTIFHQLSYHSSISDSAFYHFVYNNFDSLLSLLSLSNSPLLLIADNTSNNNNNNIEDDNENEVHQEDDFQCNGDDEVGDDNYDGDIDEKGDKNKKEKNDVEERTRNRARKGIEMIFKHMLVDQPTARNKKISAEVLVHLLFSRLLSSFSSSSSSSPFTALHSQLKIFLRLIETIHTNPHLIEISLPSDLVDHLLHFSILKALPISSDRECVLINQGIVEICQKCVVYLMQYHYDGMVEIEGVMEIVKRALGGEKEGGMRSGSETDAMQRAISMLNLLSISFPSHPVLFSFFASFSSQILPTYLLHHHNDQSRSSSSSSSSPSLSPSLLSLNGEMNGFIPLIVSSRLEGENEEMFRSVFNPMLTSSPGYKLFLLSLLFHLLSSLDRREQRMNRLEIEEIHMEVLITLLFDTSPFPSSFLFSLPSSLRSLQSPYHLLHHLFSLFEDVRIEVTKRMIGYLFTPDLPSFIPSADLIFSLISLPSAPSQSACVGNDSLIDAIHMMVSGITQDKLEEEGEEEVMKVMCGYLKIIFLSPLEEDSSNREMKGSILFSNACKIWEDLISLLQYYLLSPSLSSLSLFFFHLHNTLLSIDPSSFDPSSIFFHQLLFPSSPFSNLSFFFSLIFPSASHSTPVSHSASHSPSHEEVRNGMIKIMKEWMIRFPPSSFPSSHPHFHHLSSLTLFQFTAGVIEEGGMQGIWEHLTLFNDEWEVNYGVGEIMLYALGVWNNFGLFIEPLFLLLLSSLPTLTSILSQLMAEALPIEHLSSYDEYDSMIVDLSSNHSSNNEGNQSSGMRKMDKEQRKKMVRMMEWSVMAFNNLLHQSSKLSSTLEEMDNEKSSLISFLVLSLQFIIQHMESVELILLKFILPLTQLLQNLSENPIKHKEFVNEDGLYYLATCWDSLINLYSSTLLNNNNNNNNHQDNILDLDQITCMEEAIISITSLLISFSSIPYLRLHLVGEGIIKTAMKLIVMTESKEEIVKKVCEMFNNLSTDPVAKTEITDSPEIDQLLVLIDHVNSNISSAALACYFRLGGVKSRCTITKERQEYFRCRTCGLNEGICLPCAKSCHRGHYLSPMLFGDLRCSCGQTPFCLITHYPTLRVQLPLKVCTYQHSGMNYSEQIWYYCKTCFKEQAKGVCAICALHCHHGHDLRFGGENRFYCDCNSRYGNLCKCLQQPEVEAGKVPRMRKQKFLNERKMDFLDDDPNDPSSSGKDEEDNNCVVCMENPKEALFYKCGHLVTCMDCGYLIKQRNDNCVICRSPVLDVVQTFRV